MAEIVNDRDLLIMAASTRFLNPDSAFINLTASAPGFHLTGAGVVDLATVTVTADLIALDGDVVFTGKGVTLSNVKARSVDAAYVSGTGIVTATVVTNGETFVRSYVIPVLRDGAAGAPGVAGAPTYTWIKYADSAAGAGMSDDPTGKAYIGLAYNKASATESTTASDYAWSLIKGTDGQPGGQGADGATLYTWIKYSDVADGTGLYDTPTASTLYIGIATNKSTATESTVKTDYVWSKFKGDQGVQGPTTYTWVKYADSAAGAGISNDPTGKLYIGFAYNKTTATESNTPGDYKWALIKGDQGAQGNQGVQGPIGPNGQPTYTWIKYSDNADGTGLYDTPTASTLYIGIAPNKTVQAESDNKADYLWSRFKGDPGADFAALYKWEFRNSLEGWSVVNAATATLNADSFTLNATGFDPIIRSPIGLNFDGGTYPLVRARIKRLAGTGWDGNLFFATNTPGYQGEGQGGAGYIADPTKPNEWAIAEWNMSSNAAWSTGSVSYFRPDMGVTAADKFEIDWIMVGKIGAAVSISEYGIAKAAADAALARSDAAANDGILDRSEKADLVTDWQTEDAIIAQFNAQANALGVDISQYVANHNATHNYLTALRPYWDDTSQDTPIDRALHRNRFKWLYEARQIAQNAIAAKAATTSTWAGTVGRPYDVSNLVRKGAFDDGVMGGWPAQGLENVVNPGCPYSKNIWMRQRDTLEAENYIPVTPGETLYFNAWLETTLTTYYCFLGAFIRDKAGTIVAYVTAAGRGPGLGWGLCEGIWEMPPGAATAQPWLQMSGSDFTGQQFLRAAGLWIGRHARGATVGAPPGTNVGNTPAAIVEANANAGAAAANRPPLTINAIADSFYSLNRSSNGVNLGAYTANTNNAVGAVTYVWSIESGTGYAVADSSTKGQTFYVRNKGPMAYGTWDNYVTVTATDSIGRSASIGLVITIEAT